MRPTGAPASLFSFLHLRLWGGYAQFWLYGRHAREETRTAVSNHFAFFVRDVQSATQRYGHEHVARRRGGAHGTARSRGRRRVRIATDSAQAGAAHLGD